MTDCNKEDDSLFGIKLSRATIALLKKSGAASIRPKTIPEPSIEFQRFEDLPNESGSMYSTSTSNRKLESKYQLFKSKCSSAFQKYSEIKRSSSMATPGNPAIPIAKFIDTLVAINTTLSRQQVILLIQENGINLSDLTEWSEYYSICKQVLGPILGLKFKPKSRANYQQKFYQSSMNMSQSSRPGNVADDEDDGVNSESVPILFGKEAGETKDAMVEIIKMNARQQRQFDKMSSAKRTGSTSIPPSYTRPLGKQLVYELANPDANVHEKWDAAKESRRLREKAIETRKARSDIIESVKRTVITCDRTEIEKAVLLRQQQIREEVDNNYEYRRSLEEASRQNFEQWQEVDRYNKSLSASSLRNALFTSSQYSKSLIEYERVEKLSRKVTSIKPLSEFTSSKVDIPDSIAKNVKYAKKLSEYRKARSYADDLVTSTLSQRIVEQARSRQKAIAQSQSSGAVVALSPMHGYHYFGNFDDEDLTTVDYSQYVLDSPQRTAVSASRCKVSRGTTKKFAATSNHNWSANDDANDDMSFHTDPRLHPPPDHYQEGFNDNFSR